jgi:outer membrane protein assembly factor BamD
MKYLLTRVSTACLLVGLAVPSQAGIFSAMHERHKNKKTEKQEAQMQNESKQPDKILYDKAMKAMKDGHYDVARLDLQTMLNTYPESEYQMRAKLAVGDSWFKEGGTAALAQAEAEYKDFITFFPNEPEAAEAQMRVADIYYKQMEKPDRDHTNADRAEAEYKTMIQQFPDSPLVPRAKQKLREVQEVLAERQYRIGAFYLSQENWPAAIARLQTLTDRYPLYSHSDLALIDLGDAYRGEALFIQKLNIKPAAKQRLMKAYDDEAVANYSRVVTHYAMAPHVEEARERLIVLNRPVIEPTPEQLAASEAEEQSRTGVNLKNRAIFLFKKGPSTVDAAHVGAPTITNTPEITAPEVNKRNREMFEAAAKGTPMPSPLGATPAPTEAAETTPTGQTPAEGAPTGPLQLENIPSAQNSPGSSPAIGATVVTPGGASNPSTPPKNASPKPATPSTIPGADAAAEAAGVPGAQNEGGLGSVGPTNNKPLPAVEKSAEALPQVNDVHGANTAQVQTGTTSGASKKKPKEPKFDSSTESSSKHKKKKGLDKLNPF